MVSALGGLVADVKNDFIRTLFIMAADGDAARLRDAAKALQADGTAWLRDDQEFTGEAAYAWFADMRYRGQSFEIEVPLASSLIEAGDMAAIAEAFHRAHEGIYDFCDRDSAVQIMNLRLVVSGASPKPYLRPLARAASEAPVAEQTLKVFFDGDWHDVPFYRRAGAGSASPLFRPLRHRAGRHDGLRAARLRRHGGRQRQHRSRAGGVTAMKVDKVTLEILANHCGPRPRAWPIRSIAPRIRRSSRRPRTSPSRSSTRRAARPPCPWTSARPGIPASTTAASFR